MREDGLHPAPRAARAVRRLQLIRVLCGAQPQVSNSCAINWHPRGNPGWRASGESLGSRESVAPRAAGWWRGGPAWSSTPSTRRVMPVAREASLRATVTPRLSLRGCHREGLSLGHATGYRPFLRTLGTLSNVDSFWCRAPALHLRDNDHWRSSVLASRWHPWSTHFSGQPEAGRGTIGSTKSERPA